jgi:hypothetical protein
MLTLLACLYVGTAASARAAPSAQALGAHIELDADPATAGVQTQVAYLQGAADVEVHVLIEDAPEAGAYGIELYYGGSPLDFDGWTDGTFLTSTGRSPACLETLTQTTAHLGCVTFGAWPPGASGSGLLAVLHFRASGVGMACITPIDVELVSVDGEPLAVSAERACISVFPADASACANPLLPAQADPDGDTLSNAEEAATGTDPCNADSDGDLCRDWTELYAGPLQGGHRDPLNPWDFFDPNRSGRVDAVDIGLVRRAVLTVSGYVAARDRTIVGPEIWDLGPPDGVINAVDVVAVKAQFGHGCV